MREVVCPMLTKYYKRYVPHDRHKSRKRSLKTILTIRVDPTRRPSSVVVIRGDKNSEMILLLLRHITPANNIK